MGTSDYGKKNRCLPKKDARTSESVTQEAGYGTGHLLVISKGHLWSMGSPLRIYIHSGNLPCTWVLGFCVPSPPVQHGALLPPPWVPG
jgi:hypothetical protein